MGVQELAFVVDDMEPIMEGLTAVWCPLLLPSNKIWDSRQVFTEHPTACH